MEGLGRDFHDSMMRIIGGRVRASGGSPQDIIITVVSQVSAHGCLNIHRNFGLHGYLPGT